jgi:hypothetical protein
MNTVFLLLLRKKQLTEQQQQKTGVVVLSSMKRFLSRQRLIQNFEILREKKS